MANNRSIKTTQTVFAIVQVISERETATLTEVANDVGIAKSTAHKHLTALQETGYVLKEQDVYRLSLRFLEHGIRTKRSYEVVQVALPKLEELADETGEAVWIVVEENGWAVNLHNVKGERAVQTLTDIGQRIPMHQSAAGKCILAHLPAQRIDEIIAERGLEDRTEHTITSRKALEEELERIREQGYAYNDREIISNVRAVGAPILVEGQPVGGLSIAGPANRLKGEFFEKRIPDLLLGAINEIELRLEFADDVRGR